MGPSSRDIRLWRPESGSSRCRTFIIAHCQALEGAWPLSGQGFSVETGQSYQSKRGSPSPLLLVLVVLVLLPTPFPSSPWARVHRADPSAVLGVPLPSPIPPHRPRKGTVDFTMC